MSRANEFSRPAPDFSPRVLNEAAGLLNVYSDLDFEIADSEEDICLVASRALTVLGTDLWPLDIDFAPLAAVQGLSGAAIWPYFDLQGDFAAFLGGHIFPELYQRLGTAVMIALRSLADRKISLVAPASLAHRPEVQDVMREGLRLGLAAQLAFVILDETAKAKAVGELVTLAANGNLPLGFNRDSDFLFVVRRPPVSWLPGVTD